MNKLSKLLIAGTALLGSAASNASYMPFGVQTDIAQGTVDSWGWTSCYSVPTLAQSGASMQISDVKSACAYDSIMMGIYNTQSSSFEILAAGAHDFVFGDVGNVYSQHLGADFNLDNGVNWYLYDNPAGNYGAWGFYNNLSSARPSHCDYIGSGDVNKFAMCVHLEENPSSQDADVFNNHFYNGYAFVEAGDFTYTGGAEQFEFRLLGQGAQAQISEPTHLMLLGLGLMLLGLRRKK